MENKKKIQVKVIGSFKSENDKIKKALVVANGYIKNYLSTSEIIKKYYGFNSDDFTVAVDGGALNCINLKIMPDIIIGDMDSLTAAIISKLNAVKKELKFINCSHDKDESDTQLALDYLKNRDFKKILIIGALGNRVDHSFANLILIAAEKYGDIDIRILSENSEIFTVNSSCKIMGTTGKKISIFSLTPHTYFEKTYGLKYKLKKEKLLFSPVRGLSNEFTKDYAKIDISEGKLLIIKEI